MAASIYATGPNCPGTEMSGPNCPGPNRPALFYNMDPMRARYQNGEAVMVSFARQYRLLCWKNWLLVKRKPIVTTLEILLPTLLSIILLILRTRLKASVIAEPTPHENFTVEDRLPAPQIQFPQLPPDNVLLYAPNSTGVINIVTRVLSRLKPAPLPAMPGMLGQGPPAANVPQVPPPNVLRGMAFESEHAIEEYVRKVPPNAYLISVVFNNLVFNDEHLRQVHYSIRPKSDFSGEIEDSTLEQTYAWSTNLMYPSKTTPKLRESDKYGLSYPGYYNSSFLALQRALDFSIIQEFKSDVNLDEVEVLLQRFPDPEGSRHDPFVSVLQEQLPLIIMLSFIISAPVICKDIVLEKEKKLKESMKLMGMKAYLYWLAWILKFIICMMVSVAIMTLLFHVKTENGSMVTYTNPSITFVFLTLFTMTVIVFCCAMSTFFSHSNAAAAAGAIIYILLYMPYFFLSFRMDSLSYQTKMALSLDMNLAMSFGCVIMAQYEDMGVGLQWNNLHLPVNINEKFTMAHVFIMMAVDIIYFSIITWYFDALLPGDFGMPQPFYFPFTAWYWCGRTDQKIRDVADEDDFAAPSYGNRFEFFEDGDPAAKIGIRIRHLRKVFPGAPKPAVVDLSIDMYVGEITALLGHNGAGKTTTMYMLTGFLPPTEGTAYINGLDIRRDMVRIRQSLGLCPQHDILFDKMTVVEHLTFFAKLKGCPHVKVKEEVDNMVDVLQLRDKRDSFSMNLSGGMKRKLSVGIALIAGSKFVILDEPTSGMDPEARRETWDILQSQRTDRTIILSTHFMDEADLLGDRIAIMADGDLKCCGTSMFLKKKYGIGYHLTIVRGSKSKSKRITKLIRSYVEQARLEAKVGSELAYILPRESSGKFEELFNAIERNRQSLGIDSYGASVTTMEEVFIRVGESVSRKSISTSDPKALPKKEIEYATRLSTRPVSATVSGVRGVTESETSDSTMGSIHTFGRPASATGVNVDREPPKSALASTPNQSPALLNYLSTKLANLKETRSASKPYEFRGQGKNALVATDNLDSMSAASGVTSDTELNTASDTFLMGPVPVINIPVDEKKSDPRTTATSSTSTSRQSWEFSLPPGANRDAALAALADGKQQQLEQMLKQTEGNDMRREVSNPEMKFAPPVKHSKQSKRESRSSRRKSSWLKGVPEDELEQSRTSFESSDSSTETAEDVIYKFNSVKGVQLVLYHYRAMLIKRIIHSWRNRLVTSVQLFVPVLFLIIACIIEMYMPSAGRPIALPLNLSYFGSVVVPLYVDPEAVDINTARQLRDTYSDLVSNPPKIKDLDIKIDDYLLGVANKNMEQYRREYVVAASFTTRSTTNKTLVGHFSNEAFHTIAISLAVIDATILKHLVGTGYTITTTNYPLPRSDNVQASSEIINKRMAGFVFAYCMTFGLAFLLSTFIVFPIKEQSIRSRHIQYVSGIRPMNYWITTFIWDLANYVIPAILMTCVLELFRIEAFTTDKNLFYVFLLLIFYALAALPVTYLESLGFQEAASGYVWATVINIMTDTVAMVIIYILKMPGVQAMKAAEILEWFFYATLPNYCFSGGIQTLYENFMNLDLCDTNDMKLMCDALKGTEITNLCCPGHCGKLCAKMNTNYLAIDYPGVGRSLIFLGFHFVLFFLILLGTESNQANRARRRVVTGMRMDVDPMEDMDDEPGQDSDVRAETKRVLETPLPDLVKEEILVLKQMTKIYSNDFLAVDRLTIGIKPGECFGLLGINGAGKTTTFKMLTGDELITSGECYIDGFDVMHDIRKAHKLIGYCPQFDALIDQMTVTETLWMFSRLRGILEKDIEDIVSSLITLVLLDKHRFKEAGNLSGGNRRKLSTAVALTGNPKIVFLDEPSTGMDPGARRLLWNVLAKIRESGRTLVLTSHSMEECEALCTRLAIMVNGRFKCLGSTQHLKTKFGRGYTVIVKVSSIGDKSAILERVRRLIDYFTESFPGSTLKDRHEGLVHFHIHTVGATWAIIFGTMERIKVDFDIDDYSVSQTTLEQVFVSFARVQQTTTVAPLTCNQKCSKFCCPQAPST